MAADPHSILQQAEKEVKSASGGWSLFSDKEEKWENAADLYDEAGNVFQAQKQYAEAGPAFEKAADIQQNKMKRANPDGAARALVKAFKSYQLGKLYNEAVRVLPPAIAYFTRSGNHSRAANLQSDFAKLFEEMGDIDQALTYFRGAADAYDTAGSPALASPNKVRIAELSAVKGDYQSAAATYEELANWALTNASMKYSVKTYYLKSGLCYLKIDTITLQKKLDEYCQKDAYFYNSNEFILLRDLLNAVEANDEKAFNAGQEKFERLIPLDYTWRRVLDDIRGGLQALENDFA